MHRSDSAKPHHTPFEQTFCLVSHDGHVVELTDGHLRGESLGKAAEPLTLCRSEYDRLQFVSMNRPDAAPKAETAQGFRIHWGGPAPAGHFQIFDMGRPLVIEGDGRLTWGDQDRATFFSLVRSDTVLLAAHIVKNSWIVLGAERLVEPEHIAVVAGPALSIDGTVISLAEIESSCLVWNERRNTAPKDITIRYDGWKIRRLTLFKPLIYMAAFGHGGVFDCAELAIHSLMKFGAYPGDVMLLTSDENRNFADRLPRELRHRVHAVTCPAEDVVDFLVARFRITDVETAQSYQPIVYMDTDVLIDAPLNPLLMRLATSNAVHLTSVGKATLMEDSNYYGSELFHQDAMAGMNEAEGFNSGIIAFRNVDDARETFDHVASAIYGYAVAASERMFYPAADQCMANYVLHREGRIDGSLLTPWVELANHTIPLDRPVRCGFVHFIGGVGNSSPKIVQMQRYLRMMDEG